jgi:hypothetical protein
MKRWLVLLLMFALADSLGGGAVAGAPLDLPKSATKIFDLKPGVTYQASLFVPHVRMTIPAAGWQGSQHATSGYDWFFVGWRDLGGMAVISAPATTQSAATTLHRLETERAQGTKVGIRIKHAAAVRIGGFGGQEFDGTVVGKFGHTFSPFSTSTGGASSSAGDHWRLPYSRSFRVIVLSVRGKPVVFIMDSGHTAQLNPAFRHATDQLLKLLRFPK